MEDTHPLSKVADDALLRRLAELVGQSRRTEAELVAHIAEVDARRLYAREASPSMFAYCTEALHLSEAEAYLRICAARASREHPVLLVMLGDGRLHLSGIGKLAPHLTPANRDRLLARAAHRSKRQILELVAELLPRPDVPDRITRLCDANGRPSIATLAAPPAPAVEPQVPAPPQPPAAHDPEQLRPDAAGATPSQGATAPASFSPGRAAIRGATAPASVEPLAAERYRVQFTASRELCVKLERLRRLLPSTAALDLASIIELAVTEKIERLEAQRLAATRRRHGGPATAAAPASPTSADGPASPASGPFSVASTRHIPAAVRRAVHERDGDRCSYRDDAGRRCSGRGPLEFHHLHPFGMGGEHSVGNVRLLCHAHDAYLAEVDYGRAALHRHVARGAPRERSC